MSKEEICVYKISSEMLSDLYKIMKMFYKKKHIEQDIPGTEKAVKSIISFYLTNRKQFEAILCIHSNAHSKEALRPFGMKRIMFENIVLRLRMRIGMKILVLGQQHQIMKL